MAHTLGRDLSWRNRFAGVMVGMTALCVLVGVSLLGCDGSGTQTTTGKGIAGALVDTHGQPVAGAMVKVLPASFGPNIVTGITDSIGLTTVTTDMRGRYAIPNLEVGVYNLFGTGPMNQGTVLIPRVKYLEQAADLGVDTLKAPGVLVGQVQSEEGQVPLTFCFLEGSNYAAITDLNGRFRLPNLAEGVYRLNYFAEGYERAADSVLVRSGDTLTLPAKVLVRDLSLQPPWPHLLSTTYDSVYGKVTLKWNAVHAADLKEYVIETEDFPKWDSHNNGSWTGTDTIYRRESILEFGVYSRFRVEPFTRTYWVRSRDQEGNLSPKKDSVSLFLIEPTIFQTEFSLHALIDSMTGSSCADTLAFALHMSYSPDSQVRVGWHVAKSLRSYREYGPWTSMYDSVKVSVGAPRFDTLYLARREILQVQPRSDTVALTDSVFVRARVAYLDALIRSVTIPLGIDSLGCFHTGQPMMATRGKAP